MLSFSGRAVTGFMGWARSACGSFYDPPHLVIAGDLISGSVGSRGAGAAVAGVAAMAAFAAVAAGYASARAGVERWRLGVFV